MYKNAQWPLTLYFDGACPLCAQEIKLLRAKASPARLLFVDISEGGFDASAVGFSLEAMQSSLHARFSDGGWGLGDGVGRDLVELARRRSRHLGHPVVMARDEALAKSGLPFFLPLAPAPGVVTASGWQSTLSRPSVRYCAK